MENKDLNLNLNHEEIESNEHEIRLAKVKTMQEAGRNPWPAHRPVDCTTKEAKFSELDKPDPEKDYQLAGRLMTRRDHGKTFFGDIQDRDGRIQIYIKKNDIGDEAFDFFKHLIDLGDIIWVKGKIFVTKMGEITLHVNDIDLLSKCLHPLPEKFHGLTDIEQRYRQRYLDLISNPESREKFICRSKIIQSIRDFLQDKDFLEVETPMLHPIPGGATAKPFITHHNAYDMELFLRIAPELYLKMLTIGGLERVFEINRNFRNEGISTKHNPEFTSLEFYMAHGDYTIGMDITEKLFRVAAEKACGALQITFENKILDLSKSFARLTIKESLITIGGFSEDEISKHNIDETFKKKKINLPLHNVYGVKLFELFEHCVESKIVQPTFITGHPIEVSPLSKADAKDPSKAARFELFACGMELANGFSELNDPFVQAERFKDQVSARDAGDQEAHHYDANFVKALEYALPPTIGVGIGIDRLVMLLTNTTSIKDVIFFPTLKKTNT